jgi:hypothetical protein
MMLRIRRNAQAILAQIADWLRYGDESFSASSQDNNHPAIGK